MKRFLFTAFLTLVSCLFVQLSAQVFSDAPNLAIPDNSCASSGHVTTDITVSGVSGSLGSTATLDSVCVNVNHAWIGDVGLELIHPNGTASVDLVTSFFNSGDNYTETCFKATASETIHDAASGGSASAPFTGAFLPESPFTNFNTLTPNGDWTLKLCDNVPMNVGSLTNWRLVFSGASMGCDVNLNITTNPATGVYQASNSITSNATILSGRDVTFRAGNEITLNFPFEVILNGLFTAEIGPCN